VKRVALALVTGFALVSRVASAQEPPPPPAAQGGASLAFVGGYRGIYDLSILGAGVLFSYGSSGPLSGNFNLRAIGGRTYGGLTVFEAATSGTVEYTLRSGFRFGGGVGLALFSVTRATTGTPIVSVGPEALARVGYDFAPRRSAFIVVDFEAEWQAGDGNSLGTLVWGPTLGVGYRF
jgi:hypothetical protein